MADWQISCTCPIYINLLPMGIPYYPDQTRDVFMLLKLLLPYMILQLLPNQYISWIKFITSYSFFTSWEKGNSQWRKGSTFLTGGAQFHPKKISGGTKWGEGEKYAFLNYIQHNMSGTLVCLVHNYPRFFLILRFLSWILVGIA